MYAYFSELAVIVKKSTFVKGFTSYSRENFKDPVKYVTTATYSAAHLPLIFFLVVYCTASYIQETPMAI